MKYPKRSQYKHAKSRYRVRNWAEYEAGLQKRGDLTVWLSDVALDAWRAPASGKPGGQRMTIKKRWQLVAGTLGPGCPTSIAVDGTIVVDPIRGNGYWYPNAPHWRRPMQ